jgi:chaperonin cofactor prefoldin
MATTRNQELHTSINQSHVSIEHLTSQMDSTNSRIDKLEHKFNNMESNLTTQLTSLQSIVNQFLNRPMGPSSSKQPDVVDSSQSSHFFPT